MAQELIEASDLFLLVIAHPDDESMFFFPTIHTLIRGSCVSIPFRILCLSSGNYDGLGKVREKELRKAAPVLGMDSGAVTILNDQSLQDDPNVDWNSVVVRDCVESHVKLLATQISAQRLCPRDVIRITVVTFDEHGVSGHRNHTSVFRGVKELATMKDSDLQGISLRLMVLSVSRSIRLHIGEPCLSLEGVINSSIAVRLVQKIEHNIQSLHIFQHFG